MAPRKPRTVSKEAIKAKADKAAKLSAGEDVTEPPKPMTPPVVPAAVLRAEAKKKAASPGKRGRPSAYTPAVGKAVCKMLASGMTVRQISRRPAMPAASTIVGWAMDVGHPFSEQYMRARAVGYTLMVDEMVEISDDSRNDWIDREITEGVMGSVLNRDHLDRTKVRIDTRKWIVARALPKFADKMSVEHTGKDGGPIDTREVPQATGSDHLSEITRRYVAKAAPAKAPEAPAPAVSKPASKSQGRQGLH